MPKSINDLKFGFNFDKLKLTYSLNSSESKWDGQIVDTNGSVTKVLFTNKLDLNSTWKTDVRTALGLWDGYSALEIKEETGSIDANIYAYRSDVLGQAGGTAWFDTLNQTSHGNILTNSNYTRSEFVFDNTAISVYDTTLGFREYIALHEIGHALGLKGDNPISFEYSTDMTVMSYSVVGAGYNVSTGGFLNISNGRFPVSPMAYDIAAIESIYGKINVATGNTTYDSTYFTGAKRSFTIKDDGGIDTFDLSNYSGATGASIDLNPTLGINDEWLDRKTVVGDEYIYLARGTNIENVIGTSKVDFIVGNSSDNEITGGKGDDSLTGWFGSDTYKFSGKYGNDTITGGAGNIDKNDKIVIENVQFSGTATKTSASTNYELLGKTIQVISGNVATDATIRIMDGSNSITLENFTNGDYGITLGSAGQDLAFVIDTTGSMADDIFAVQFKAGEIIDSIFNPARNLTDSRIAIVGYNDPTTSTILPFTNQSDSEDRKTAALDAINSIRVSGGGDLPELTYTGLLRALDGSIGKWREDAVSRKIILFGDAPAKDNTLAKQVYDLAANTNVDTPTPTAITSLSTFALTDTISLTSFSANEVNELTGKERKVPVQIFTVSIGFDPNNKAEFKEIAEATGGTTFSTTTFFELINALLEIIHLPIYTISADTVSIEEGDSGTQAVIYTISRDVSDSAVTVEVERTGTADNMDITAVPEMIHFAEGETTKTINVAIHGDTEVEADETISLNIASVSETATFDTNPVTATIINDDTGANEITGTSGRDILTGTPANDVISSLSGSIDRMSGGDGADIFVFGAETGNGIRERDIILDYEVGIDAIRLEEGATVGDIRETSSGVVVFLEGDRDAIYVQGEAVTVGSLDFVPENIVAAA